MGSKTSWEDLPISPNSLSIRQHTRNGRGYLQRESLQSKWLFIPMEGRVGTKCEKTNPSCLTKQRILNSLSVINIMCSEPPEYREILLVSGAYMLTFSIINQRDYLWLALRPLSHLRSTQLQNQIKYSRKNPFQPGESKVNEKNARP
jgi:hypothetical protein